eukprot:468500_1
MESPEQIWQLFVLSLIVLCVLLDIIILLTSIARFYGPKRNIEYTETKFEFDKRWALIFILLVILTAVSDFIHLYIGHTYDDSSIYGNKFRFIISIADTFYFFYTIQF